MGATSTAEEGHAPTGRWISQWRGSVCRLVLEMEIGYWEFGLGTSWHWVGVDSDAKRGSLQSGIKMVSRVDGM